jgi:hypothetical protein
MRVDTGSDRREIPRWALWLVAVVCFGPLTLTWLLGVLMTPIWIAMLTALLAAPEQFAHDPDANIWVFALPIGLVIGGLIGLIGIIRVLTLSRRERPKSHRFFTIGMVAVGLVTALTFNQPYVEEGTFDFSAVISVAGLVGVLLPVMGAALLLATSWRLLIAAPVGAHRSRIQREHRDEWRLDA